MLNISQQSNCIWKQKVSLSTPEAKLMACDIYIFIKYHMLVYCEFFIVVFRGICKCASEQKVTIHFVTPMMDLFLHLTMQNKLQYIVCTT